MSKLTLSKPITTPDGPKTDFDLPEEATMRLFRGTKLPFTVDANSMRIDFNLEADSFNQIVANLLQIPPSFAWNISFQQMSEVMKAALPLLPPEWRNSALASKMMSAT